MAKAASTKKKTGRARTISKLKRSNQRKNKLIKRGKLKPNSSSPYVTAQMIKGQKKRDKKERDKARQEGKRKEAPRRVEEEAEEDEEMEVPEEDMMDDEDAFLLHKLSRGKILGEDGSKKNKRKKGAEDEGEEDDEGELDDVEDAAVKRYEHDRKTTKVEKALLPIKTKEGLVTKTMEVEAREDEDEDPEEDQQGDSGVEEADESGEEDEGLILNGETSKSVVSLLAEREQALSDLKLKVGNLASSFLEAPEERVGQLEKLVQMLDKLPVHVRTVGFKLVASTITELLKDVIPSYKIAHHNPSDDTLQKKETMRLQKYESAVLQCAKSTLVKFEKYIKDPQSVASTLGLHALKCACDVLVSHPQFNYSPNILKLIVPAMDNASEVVRTCVREAVRQVFRDDKRGEVTLIGVRYIKGYIKSKRYRCRPSFVECFLGVKLNYIERAMAEESERREKEAEQARRNKAKRNEQVSKREKKRQKQLKKVEREMLEARGEEARHVRNRNYTEVAKVVFEVLFRVVKSAQEDAKSVAKLLPATLRCISAFCHAINVDFFDDLLRVMSDLVKGGALRHAEHLLCIKTAFDILSGPGEFLTYDPGNFTKALYAILPKLPSIAAKDADDDSFTIPTVCAVVRKMLVTRKRLVSKDVVRAFSRALAYSTVQLASAGMNEQTVELLRVLDEVRCAHVRTFEALLDPEEEEQAPPGVVVGLGAGLGNGEARTFSLLKLQPLARNPDSAVAKAARKVINVKR